MMDIERLRMAHEAASATNTHFSIRTEDGDEEAATAIREFYGLAMAAMPGLLDAASQAIPADPVASSRIETEMTRFMQSRIENMQILPEEIASRLAKYGLMLPSAFVAEMRERMASQDDGDEAGIEIDRESMADALFEHYDFGDGVQVLNHGCWDSSDPLDFTKTVYVEYQDDAPDADSRKVSFHVRFTARGSALEAYALECDRGQDIGVPVVPCVQVEYDLSFWGGDYDGVGQFVHIPLSLIEECALQDPDGDDGVELAFTKTTKQDCVHIIHYTLDELYDQGGNPLGHHGVRAGRPA
ncbi:MAG: hypothetical protein KJZ65_15675 [Phycisphaerales bacterium]|nr:hypothetical protein [Phycisphaerales bacterium]